MAEEGTNTEDLELSEEDKAILHDPILDTIRGKTDEVMTDVEIQMALDRGIVTQEEVDAAKAEAAATAKEVAAKPEKAKKGGSDRKRNSDRQKEVAKIVAALRESGDQGMSAFDLAKAIGAITEDADPKSQSTKDALKGIRSLARQAVDSSGGDRTSTSGRNKIYKIPGVIPVADVTIPESTETPEPIDVNLVAGVEDVEDVEDENEEGSEEE